MSDEPHKKLKIIKASHLLQAKVGIGKIDEKKIKKSQKVIDSNDTDFPPMAAGFLSEMDTAIRRVEKNEFNSVELAIDALTSPVMQIKANAAMFGYPLVGALAGIMLNFLESIGKIDDDVLEIVRAHHKTLSLLVRDKVSGEGGEYGEELKKELHDVCRRYFARHGSGHDSNEEPFFVDV